MCLEGPENGVYYRGEGNITNKTCEVELPEYVKHIAFNFTVYVNQIIENDEEELINIASSRVKNNKFIVKSNGNCKFSWLVMGKRNDINVEPMKETHNIKGDGPYTYLTAKDYI
jgi:hypothetical protein